MYISMVLRKKNIQICMTVYCSLKNSMWKAYKMQKSLLDEEKSWGLSITLQSSNIRPSC